jgi:hypothetical protein
LLEIVLRYLEQKLEQGRLERYQAISMYAVKSLVLKMLTKTLLLSLSTVIFDFLERLILFRKRWAKMRLSELVNERNMYKLKSFGEARKNFVVVFEYQGM